MRSALALLVVWFVLARAVTPGLVVGGVLVVAIAVWLVPPTPGPRLRWWRLPRLVLHEAISIAKATLAVTKQTVTPGSPTPAVLEMVLPDARPAELTWLATLLTLTPGTYVVDIDPTAYRMTVHLLDGSRLDEATADVLRLDQDVRAMFGDEPSSTPRSRLRKATP